MLQLRMNNSLSVERIVRALNTSNCIIEEENTIRVLKNQGYQAYEKEKALMINEDETINDFIKIINAMNVEIPYSRYKSEKFDKYLKI